MPKNSTTLLLACLASLVAPPRPTPPRRPAGGRESFWSLLSLLLQLSQVVSQNSWNRTPKVHGPPSIVHCIALLFPYHHHSLNRSFSFNSAFSHGLCQTKAALSPHRHSLCPSRTALQAPPALTVARAATSTTYFTMVNRTRPSAYKPVLPFHAVRAATALSVIISFSILIYFCIQLRSDSFRLPWTFLVVRRFALD